MLGPAASLLSSSLDFVIPRSVLWAFAIALVVSAAGTLCMRWLAPRIGALDMPDARRVHDAPVPRLGGIGMWAGVAVAIGLLINWDPISHQGALFAEQMAATLAAAALVVFVGAMDDLHHLNWKPKLFGQIGAAAIAVFGPLAGATAVAATDLTLVVQRLDLPLAPAWNLPLFLGAAIPILVLVGAMNMMNFIDGVDGLAGGITAITGMTFAVLAMSYNRVNVSILAASVAGAAIGFLVHNYRKGGARIFMGDSGSMLVGFLLAVIAIQGLLKTAAAVTTLIPLALLAVPILDTMFVVARRLRHRRSPAAPDKSHLHHRLLNVGHSPRQVSALLWAWTATMCIFALAMRFINFHDGGQWNLPGVAVMAGLAVFAAGVSVWMVFRLEILKTRAVRERNRATAQRLAERAADDRS